MILTLTTTVALTTLAHICPCDMKNSIAIPIAPVHTPKTDKLASVEATTSDYKDTNVEE